MKILVLNGSPKEENSTTMLMTNAFIEGIGNKEKTEVKKVNTYTKNIKYCKGDLACWFRQEGHCVAIQDDDMNDLLDDMVSSDMIIWSFPLHVHTMPASLKAVLDRTIALLKINMREFPEKVEHEKVVDLSAKKNVFIVSGGYPYYPDNFSGLKMQMQAYFNTPIMMCACEAALMAADSPELNMLKERLFSDFRKAGEECAEKGQPSKETIDEIEKPMIPNSAYLNIMNNMK